VIELAGNLAERLPSSLNVYSSAHLKTGF
jgi:hypothetical protein